MRAYLEIPVFSNPCIAIVNLPLPSRSKLINWLGESFMKYNAKTNNDTNDHKNRI